MNLSRREWLFGSFRPNSYVRKIVTDARGRATGAVYFDAQKKEALQRGEGGGGLRERSRAGQTAIAFEVQTVSQWAGEFERVGRQEPHVGQRLVRERAV